MFERKVPKFFKPASRASQKQMATAMRPAIAKARQASNLGEVIDAVLDIPSEYIDNKLLRLVKTHPQADLQELEDILNKQYIKRTAYASSAVGAGAAVPGSGTGIALGLTAGELAVYAVQTTSYILGVSRLHGVRPKDREQRRALVLSSLLGEQGAEIVSDQLGLRTLNWARASLKNLSSPTLGQVNKALMKYASKKLAHRTAGRMFGRLIPFGIGAGVGYLSGKAVAQRTVKGLQTALGESRDASVSDLLVELAPVIDLTSNPTRANIGEDFFAD
ncbi:hypothetical protein [uncultured Varibaculum sp.]|uniref:hypothetical protein n=1 Tax=uncultured Varibaculum sp. TaxID=413896 RepID=UPI0025994BEF|nr:hypothetical protein [uncultured Varibaculum sp.]